ncbi:TIGR02453 family protein [Polaribacter reichenbachii]|uniref:TIGR02453 family protein n=1 Tax=Polaribacter reichenbachii TaxID=996801 RepID=A0A1B8U5B1_9FLAO|nr:DUF2461 domain-containing protein [Polaribacter reichenbachii]APZ47624.1 TIGR02453 family protein [Polaribacter reichenbachii]AUC18264.1 TIGR02453 family protein [Polaribacter reichenbachii]OBY67023.1 hypothetical protein LPB301_04185 [Polaribacter reichenbachii]
MQIEKSTFQFLKDLQKNNNRDWFAEHKPTFTKIQSQVKEVFLEMQLNLEKHDEIEKMKIYRIYRDVRFSKDKTPYNPRLAVSFSRLGAALRGGYFLQIKPGETFLGGGFWQPEKDDLFRLRKEIEQDASEFYDILNDKNYIKHFGGKFAGDELKSAPRGFDKTHKDIDLLRKKGFIAIRNFTDAEVLSPNFLSELDESFKALRPFFNLFSDILTTNLNGESIID